MASTAVVCMDRGLSERPFNIQMQGSTPSNTEQQSEFIDFSGKFEGDFGLSLRSFEADEFALIGAWGLNTAQRSHWFLKGVKRHSGNPFSSLSDPFQDKPTLVNLGKFLPSSAAI